MREGAFTLLTDFSTKILRENFGPQFRSRLYRVFVRESTRSVFFPRARHHFGGPIATTTIAATKT